MVFTGIMDGDNIRMGQSGNKFCLQVEAFNKIAISGKPGRKYLYSNLPVKVFLACLVDTSHAPLTKRGQDFIVPKRHANQIVLLHDRAPLALSSGKGRGG